MTRIAWLQCVGSRDVHSKAPYCSSVCCMFAVKEAMLARGKGRLACRKPLSSTWTCAPLAQDFQRYRDMAGNQGVRFERGRIHTVDRDRKTGDLKLQYIGSDGAPKEESFDLVVLSVGQRPAAGSSGLADILGLELNDHGFVKVEPFAPTRTNQEGVSIGGSFFRPERHRRFGHLRRQRRPGRFQGAPLLGRIPGPGTGSR